MRERATHALKLSAVALSAIVLVVATGCERKPAAPAAGANGEPGATDAAVPSGAVAVTRDEARNATYPTENTASGTLRLVDGHYEDADFVEAVLDDYEAAGDVDGDGRDDRIVVLTTTTGGSGIFHELHVLRRVQGQLVVSQPALLGDRVVLNEVKVERGEVVADLIVQGPDDPQCCPTQPVTYRFRLVGNELTELTGQRAIYLKQ